MWKGAMWDYFTKIDSDASKAQCSAKNAAGSALLGYV